MKQNRGRLKDVMKQAHVSERENEAQNSWQIRSDTSEDQPKFHQKLIGISAIVLLLLLIVLIFYLTFNHIFPGLWPLLKAGDEQGIARYLELEGEWKGLMLAVVLSALQVVSIVLPGLPIHLAVGMIYGWLKASIACYIGFVLGNAFVFAVARRLGRRLGNYIPGLNRPNWLTQKINSTHPAFVVAIACMVPAVPNGAIPYIASRADITGRGYVGVVAATAWLQCVTNCLCGYFLILGQYLGAAIVFIAQLVIIGLISWKREALLGSLK